MSVQDNFSELSVGLINFYWLFFCMWILEIDFFILNRLNDYEIETIFLNNRRCLSIFTDIFMILKIWSQFSNNLLKLIMKLSKVLITSLRQPVTQFLDLLNENFLISLYTKRWGKGVLVLWQKNESYGSLFLKVKSQQEL